MNKPKKHIREKERLIELESFSIMDTLSEDEYDNITAIAAGICDTPISLVSLIDDKRQWFKSHHGLDVTETPKDYAFCGHAIHDHNEIFMVNDSRLDDRFADNPLVTDNPNVIFYAGVPLMSENDLPLGTLCVIDNKPKELSENQIKLLKALAGQVMIILKLRKAKLTMEAKIIENVKNRTLELEESLEREKELGKLKSTFVTTASHQFRTPLAVIQANVQLLEMFNASGKKIEPEKYKKVSGRITEAIAKMTELMDDVLILGKISAGKVQYDPEDIALVEFCEKLANEFNDLKTDGSHLNFVIKGEPYNVALDRKLLTHSLSNLISNAFKYSVGKKNPDLTIHFKPNEIVVSIKDYGIGIPEDELPKLFQPFFRAKNVTEIKGTGLGLSIAKDYIEVNKGQIAVKSTLGEGSCFEIIFKTNIL